MSEETHPLQLRAIERRILQERHKGVRLFYEKRDVSKLHKTMVRHYALVSLRNFAISLPRKLFCIFSFEIVNIHISSLV